MCTCWFYCFGGKRVWKATYDKHKVEVERHVALMKIDSMKDNDLMHHIFMMYQKSKEVLTLVKTHNI